MFWVRLALPHFSCISFFFLEIKSSWINLGFSVENVVENEAEILNPNRFPLYNHVFDDIFDWKSKIYPWWLDFQKKMIYMKIAEERACLKIFCQNSWKFTSSLSKSTKTTKKCVNYLLCGFLRNWRMSRYFQNLLEFPLTFGFCLKIEKLSTFLMIFHLEYFSFDVLQISVSAALLSVPESLNRLAADPPKAEWTPTSPGTRMEHLSLPPPYSFRDF